jgi:hypothetical protein
MLTLELFSKVDKGRDNLRPKKEPSEKQHPPGVKFDFEHDAFHADQMAPKLKNLQPAPR